MAASTLLREEVCIVTTVAQQPRTPPTPQSALPVGRFPPPPRPNPTVPCPPVVRPPLPFVADAAGDRTYVRTIFEGGKFFVCHKFVFFVGEVCCEEEWRVPSTLNPLAPPFVPSCA